MQISTESYLPHYEIPQLSSRQWCLDLSEIICEMYSKKLTLMTNLVVLPRLISRRSPISLELGKA